MPLGRAAQVPSIGFVWWVRSSFNRTPYPFPDCITRIGDGAHGAWDRRASADRAAAEHGGPGDEDRGAAPAAPPDDSMRTGGERARRRRRSASPRRAGHVAAERGDATPALGRVPTGLRTFRAGIAGRLRVGRGPKRIAGWPRRGGGGSSFRRETDHARAGSTDDRRHGPAPHRSSRRGRGRRPRGRAPGGPPIHDRPAAVTGPEALGHREAAWMVFGRRNGPPGVATVVEGRPPVAALLSNGDRRAHRAVARRARPRRDRIPPELASPVPAITREAVVRPASFRNAHRIRFIRVRPAEARRDRAVGTGSGRVGHRPAPARRLDRPSAPRGPPWPRQRAALRLVPGRAQRGLRRETLPPPRPSASPGRGRSAARPRAPPRPSPPSLHPLGRLDEANAIVAGHPHADTPRSR